MIQQIFFGILGFLAYYLAFFMYEDEEGVLHNRIERLWIAISDRALQTGSQSVALFTKVADVVTDVYNRIYGHHLLSLRMIGSSTSYSLGFLIIFIGLLGLFDEQQSVLNGELQYVIPALAGICIISAILPSAFPSRWSVAISLLPLILILLYFWADISHKTAANKVPENTIILAVSMFFSICSDLLLIVIVRSLVRYISVNIAIGRIILAILMQIVIGLILVFGPITVRIYLQLENEVNTGALLSRSLNIIAGFNLFTSLLCFVFVFVLLFITIHWLIWPLLGRLIYPLARFEFIRNRKALATTGTVCLMFAFGFEPSALKSIFQLLGK